METKIKQEQKQSQTLDVDEEIKIISDLSDKEEIVTLTEEEKNRFIEDLVFNKVTTYSKSLLDGKLNIKYKSLSAGEQIEIEEKIPGIKGSPSKVMHTYTLWLLAYSLVQYNDTDLSKLSIKDRFTFLNNEGGTITDILSTTYNEFQKKLQAVSKGAIIEDFLESPSTSSE